jgi:hypothetical protein
MALALMPTQEAGAQNSGGPPGSLFGGFQGTPSFDQAKATIQVSDRTTTVTVRAPTLTIDWTPTGSFAEGTGPVNFLPQGYTGIFQNDPSAVPNFAVLNRIIPANASRRVDFNGRVVSQLRDTAGNVTGPGGSVAFYSPGGIFVSSTAVFDVGSLLLTTLDPLRDGSGNFLGTAGNLSLRGAPGTTAQVVTQAGSQINATANGSTVAMVAAQVIHQGAVRVNGSAAYIGAESVDVVVNNGLFDINILSGSSVGTPVQHLGSTSGPASTGAGDNQIIYMVAVPKNQAITMTLRGSAGFDAATTATVENGEIILSAGHNVSGRTIATNPVAATEPTTGQPLLANAVIDGGTLHLRCSRPRDRRRSGENVLDRRDLQSGRDADRQPARLHRGGERAHYYGARERGRLECTRQHVRRQSERQRKWQRRPVRKRGDDSGDRREFARRYPGDGHCRRQRAWACQQRRHRWQSGNLRRRRPG